MGGARVGALFARWAARGIDVTARWNTIISLVLGVIAAIAFVTALARSGAPFGTGGTTSFVALAAIGVAT